uniref:DUF4378 domain-containing protein n=1 Tax=Leersia perrieri TaxID=77586 RepID=A0A0D9WUC8_9ORYZ
MAEILLHSNTAQPRKQRKSSRKVHGNGLEAPRNSLDLPPYDHTISTTRQKPPKGSTPEEKTTAKNVIHKDFPSQPNVIARLMGIDTIPLPAKNDAVMIHEEETSSNLKPPSKLEINVASPRSATFRQSKCSLISYRSSSSSSGDYTYRHCLKKMRPRRGRSRQHHHHHPQEELLDKIREDFQAWQTSKALENARTVVSESGRTNTSRNSIEEGRYIQMLAQENLHKEKMAKYGYGSCRISMEDKDTLKNDTDKNSDIQRATKTVVDSKSGDNKVIKVLRVRDFEDETNSSTSSKSCSQKRIVILRPSPDIGASDQESLFSSSKVKRDGNMEEFLEEVKERLKKELKLKSKSEVVRRSWGTSTDPKQIARDIAKQIRETVSMHDLGKRLYSRSESFRAFRSDRKRNAAARNASPEHIRLKSVISRTETKQQGSNDSSPPIIRSRGRIRSLTDLPLSVSGSGFDDQSCIQECEVADVAQVDADVVSPRVLVRSLSAPASGISRVGRRMFVEDDNVGSGRHGNSDAVSEGAAVAASKINSSSSFSLRGTVSNLRHSFSTRANKLFGKKTHWSKKPSLGEFHPNKMATAMTPPETFSPRTITQENFTELPPSPVSPLEVKGNSSSRHFFSDLNCTLPELSPKSWSEFDTPRLSNGSSCKNMTNTTETESYPDKAYIKQILIAAGLYDDDVSSSPSMNKANARVDSMARRPICDEVFHEVEEKYTEEEGAMDRRLLFDLANEALEILFTSVKPGSSLRRWIVDSTGVSPPVNDVWQQVQSLRNPLVQEMQTVESMVAREAQKSAWIQVLHEDAYVLGRKLERAIFDELVSDIVQELFI